MFKVGIVGATGYVGAEILRLLLSHKEVEIVGISSVSFEGQEISNIYRTFLDKSNLICENKDALIDKCDLVFTALPHGLSEDIALECLEKGKLCVDLGADFRLTSEFDYKEWYGKPFTHPSIHDKAIYGLPELNRNKIKEYKIIANPGCYPTSIELGLMPLLQNNLITFNNIICDSKSGTTGAGRGLSQKTHYPDCNENFAPYGVGTHRHTPEIEETLSAMAGNEVTVTFTPHLLPINRGIVSTIYTNLNTNKDLTEIHNLYLDTYKNEPFVQVLPLGETACINDVKLTNNCQISLHLNHRKDGIIVVSAIDNMIKGAAGQAIQNMNILLGLKETEGLELIAPAF